MSRWSGWYSRIRPSGLWHRKRTADAGHERRSGTAPASRFRSPDDSRRKSGSGNRRAGSSRGRGGTLRDDLHAINYTGGGGGAPSRYRHRQPAPPDSHPCKPGLPPTHDGPACGNAGHEPAGDLFREASRGRGRRRTGQRNGLRGHGHAEGGILRAAGGRVHAAAAAALSMAALSCAVTACGSGPAGSGTVPPGSTSVTCTGTTSDASALQRAIDSSPPGAAVGIKGGICLLTRPVMLLGDRSYLGGSTTGTVLKQDGAMSYVLGSAAYQANSVTTGNPLAIRDLTVACNGSGTTDGIIVLNWQTDVEHVDVSGCGGSGIVDTAVTAAGRAITNTSVNSRFDDNFISGSGLYGFEVADTRTAVTDGYLDGNQIASSGKGAIYLQTASGWDISGNHLYGNAGNAIDAIGLYGTTISDNRSEEHTSELQSPCNLVCRL